MRAKLVATAVLGSLALATGCGQLNVTGSSTPSSLLKQQGHAAPRTSTSTTEAPGFVAYVVPGAKDQDGTLHLRDLSSGADLLLGEYTYAAIIPGPNNVRRVLAISTTGGAAIFTTAGQRIWQGRAPSAATAMISQGSLWLQNGDSAIAVDNQGSVSSTRPLMTPRPVRNAGRPSRKGLVGAAGGGSTVGGWVTAPNGDVINLLYSGVGAAVENVTTGASQPLADYEVVQSAAVGADGMIYALAWSLDQPGATIHLVRLDPGSLQIVSDADTGLAPSSTDSTNVLATASHGVLLLIGQGDAGSAITLHAFAIHTDGSLSSGPALPQNVGLYGTVEPNDQVLLYGGPAQNNVSVLDLNTGTVTPEPSVSAPAGTYIQSVG
ncbi:MAG TPA: hypothetical protein VNE21_04670 [Mycobacteriales bacterium]|nr:hypothetical protein [Mycobacteriales bacterium]